MSTLPTLFEQHIDGSFTVSDQVPSRNPDRMEPTFYVRHPDNSFSVFDPAVHCHAIAS
ncbi:hypothetical protein [Roseateles depolymerans]|uniref:Uncharacterized protein n=1 Tax=Roseateles depolymerans TaxID=76731 RepID=A0A0U3MEA5_9BURK|nr:hypothetical protein [Roseateles depolymerans]ALV06665.1 hypothetical protein RD2015_2193 [Roseateles depolymerans]REG19642.1 hypothetical protein DES44_2142 [Roseateles depolymerans]